MMKTSVFLLLVSLLLFSAQSGKAQPQDSLNNDSIIDDEWIIDPIPTVPEFVGGEVALYDFLRKNITYPKQALNNRTEGIVWIAFVIDTSGAVTDAFVRRGIGDGCNEEALRVVSSMPPWTPGMLNDHPVRTQFNIPVRFILNDSLIVSDSAINAHGESDVYSFPSPDSEASFPGGDKALNEYIKNCMVYPAEARENNIGGVVNTSFVINEDGTVSDIKIRSGIGGGCNQEAVRIISSFPLWVPASKDGKPIPSLVTLPVQFNLRP